jgi:Protein of unknown function (DUF2971)
MTLKLDLRSHASQNIPVKQDGARRMRTHYTSLNVLEKIIQTNELWFSNPLFMNDLQEMRFGMLEGRKALDELFLVPQIITACGSSERAAIIQKWFHHYFNDFDMNQIFDVYVFCLSEHDPKNADGLLSMWRGYGGNGMGAALVFKTDFVTLSEVSPLMIAKVKYASEQDRVASMKETFTNCVDVLKRHQIPDEKLYFVSYNMFTLMKFYSLLSKHHGFAEENEWRIIYLPDRDVNGLFKEQFSYAIGKNGIEPKLRFKIEPLATETDATWTFHSILDRIILGPSISSPLALNSARRLFDTLNKPEFKQKLWPSSIPLRHHGNN